MSSIVALPSKSTILRTRGCSESSSDSFYSVTNFSIEIGEDNGDDDDVKSPCHFDVIDGYSSPPQLTDSGNRWQSAFKKIKEGLFTDPWNDFKLDDVEIEMAIRHRYSAIKKKWIQDKISIKIETLPFDHGAMRECYRM